MSITPASLWGPIALTTSNQQLNSTIPAGGLQVIKRAVFTNITGGTVGFTVYVQRGGGGSPPTTDIVIYAQSLSSGQAYTAPELASLVLNPGDALWAQCSVNNSVVAIASGFVQ